MLWRRLFLFDRKVHFLSNKKTRLCALARGEIIADATAFGAGVRQGAHFFVYSCIQLLSRQALELFAGENYNVPCGGVLRSIEKERRRHNETREGLRHE